MNRRLVFNTTWWSEEDLLCWYVFLCSSASCWLCQHHTVSCLDPSPLTVIFLSASIFSDITLWLLISGFCHVLISASLMAAPSPLLVSKLHFFPHLARRPIIYMSELFRHTKTALFHNVVVFHSVWFSSLAHKTRSHWLWQLPASSYCCASTLTKCRFTQCCYTTQQNE